MLYYVVTRRLHTCVYACISPTLPSAGVIVRFTESYPSPSNIPEGRWRAYDISLPNRPNSTVVVVFFPINTTFIAISPDYMIFEPEIWDSPQILVITATNDDINRDSPYFASFGMALFSLDENFHSAAVPEVTLSIEDNDQGTYIEHYLILVAIHLHSAVLTQIPCYVYTYMYTYIHTRTHRTPNTHAHTLDALAVSSLPPVLHVQAMLCCLVIWCGRRLLQHNGPPPSSLSL